MQPLDPLTLPLHGCRLLEASAGTGKTYTLALLFLRLLLERGLAVDQILVVTFTRAAAGELRHRIRIRVREALDHFTGRPAADPQLAALLAAVDPESGRQRLGDALVRMDEAAIFTIHGFCQRILKDHAFEAGIPFALELLEGEQALTRQVIEDFWRIRFYPAGLEEAAWAARTWNDPAGLLATLAPALRALDCDLLPRLDPAIGPELKAQCGRLFDAVQQAWPAARDEVRAILEHDSCLLRNDKAYRQEDQVPELLAAMEALSRSREFPYGLAKGIERMALSTMAGLVRKKCAGPPHHPFFLLFDRFCQSHDRFIRHQTQEVLQAALAFVRTERARRTLRLGRLSYDDLLTRLHRALLRPGSGQQLAARLGSRYPVALVDEFQDTDPVQYQLFSLIHGGGRGSLFMIGDPKQAIYAFRGADIFTYIRARRETPEPNRATLTVNHRSTPAMVQAVNTLFSLTPEAFVFSDDIPFNPVRAAAHPKGRPLMLAGQPMAPLTGLLLDSVQLSQTQAGIIGKEDAARAAISFCADSLVQLLEQAAQGRALLGGAPLTAGDIAILVRSHRQAEAMQAGLRRRGVASVYLSQDSVFAAEEAGRLALVLAALADLSDPARVRAALATELFGLSCEQIHALNRDQPSLNRRMAVLIQYQQLWRDQGFLPMFQHLLAVEQVTRRLTGRIGGERSLTNYLHLAELLQQSPAASHGMAALLRWLNQQIHHPDSDSDDQLVRLENDGQLIRILTIHRAKGLEFPVVVLPFLWAEPPGGQDRVRTFHDRASLRLAVEFGPGEEAHRQWAAQEQRAEELRLLYVAATRAKSACLFCWGRVKGMERTAAAALFHGACLPADDPALRRDLQRLNDQEPLLTLHPWTEGSHRHRLHGRQRAVTPTPRTFQGRIPSGWAMTSYSRLTAEADSARSDQAEQRQTGLAAMAEDFASVFTFPRGPAAGTCLHTLLERIDFGHSAGLQQDLVAETLEQAAIDPRWQGAVIRWIDDVLAVELPGACALAGLAPADRISELSFLFPLAQVDPQRISSLLQGAGLPPLAAGSPLQGLMKGFVDLVFRHQGRYYLLDFKSNYLGPEIRHYGPEALDECMRSHQYHLQALIYTLALHRYLGGRIADYRYEHHFGGCYYLFLRAMHPGHAPGTGIHCFRPDQALVAALDDCCRNEKSGGGK